MFYFRKKNPLFSFRHFSRIRLNTYIPCIPIFSSFQLVVYPLGWSTDRSLFMGKIIYNYKGLGRIVTKLMLIFTSGCPTRVANHSLIEACVAELEQFLCQCEKQKKKNKKKQKKIYQEKAKSLVTRISKMAGAIYFKFEMQLSVIGGTSIANLVFFGQIYECMKITTLLFLLI